MAALSNNGNSTLTLRGSDLQDPNLTRLNRALQLITLGQSISGTGGTTTVQQITEVVSGGTGGAPVSVGGIRLIDWPTLTVTGPTVINPPAPVSGDFLLIVRITQDSTGGREITWGSSMAVAPVPPVNINGDPNAPSLFLFANFGSLWVFLSLSM